MPVDSVAWSLLSSLQSTTANRQPLHTLPLGAA